MNRDTGTIAEGERGHRRGVVLGFTMAELLLLLLFCLLLVAAGVFDHQKKEIERLSNGAGAVESADARQMQYSPDAIKRLFEKLYPDGPPKLSPKEVDKLWNELVLARDAETALAEAGLTADSEQLRSMAVLTKELTTTSGLSSEQVQELAEKLERLAAAGVANLGPEQFDRLIELALRDSLDMPAGHQWPPIISIADNGNRFEVGSAAIKESFRTAIEAKYVPELLGNLQTYHADVIEIIGHTDEQPVTPTKPSNLDAAAIPAIWGKVSSDDLVAEDNTGLGMARAIAVASVLKATGKFEGYKIMALSAGQLLLPGDVLSDGSTIGDDKARRRIDIRVRRSNP